MYALTESIFSFFENTCAQILHGDINFPRYSIPHSLKIGKKDFIPRNAILLKTTSLFILFNIDARLSL